MSTSFLKWFSFHQIRSTKITNFPKDFPNTLSQWIYLHIIICLTFCSIRAIDWWSLVFGRDFAIVRMEYIELYWQKCTDNVSVSKIVFQMVTCKLAWVYFICFFSFCIVIRCTDADLCDLVTFFDFIMNFVLNCVSSLFLLQCSCAMFGELFQHNVYDILSTT